MPINTGYAVFSKFAGVILVFLAGVVAAAVILAAYPPAEGYIEAHGEEHLSWLLEVDGFRIENMPLESEGFTIGEVATETFRLLLEAAASIGLLILKLVALPALLIFISTLVHHWRRYRRTRRLVL